VQSNSSAHLVEALTDNITPYHYTALKSAMSKMIPEGKEIVKIVLDSPAELYDWSAAKIAVRPHLLKLYLKEIGWSNSKIVRGFASVKKMLDEI
jgi:hypothetical protein